MWAPPVSGESERRPRRWQRGATGVVLAVLALTAIASALWWSAEIDVFAAGSREFVLILGFAALGWVPAVLLTYLAGRRWVRRVHAAAWVAVVVMVFVPWHPRKRFVRDLDSLRVGMTVDEVETVMGRYVKGRGPQWQLPAGPGPRVLGPGEVRPADEQAALDAAVRAAYDAYEEPEYPGGDERAHATGTMTYRWCDNSDWGQVEFRDGRVVHVEFLPD